MVAPVMGLMTGLYTNHQEPLRRAGQASTIWIYLGGTVFLRGLVEVKFLCIFREYFKPSAKLCSDGYKKLATVQEHLHPSVLALSLFESMISMSTDVLSNKAGRKKKTEFRELQ